MRIERPVEANHDGWLAMWEGYNAFYKRSIAPEVTARVWERISMGTEPRGFLAVDENKPVGFVHFHFHDTNSALERSCYLQDLFTEPSVRGRGVGRELIAAVYAEADRVGSPHVYWLTQTFNTRARRLYDALADVTPFIKYARRI